MKMFTHILHNFRQVQLVDHNVLTDLRKRDEKECGHMISSSPIVHCYDQGSQLFQPLTYSLPCPPNPAARSQRPASSVTGQRKAQESGYSGGNMGDRPATARPFFNFTKKTGTEDPAILVLSKALRAHKRIMRYKGNK
jgi:hypothetical protein